MTNKQDGWSALVILLVSLGVMVYTTAPTVYIFDSGELAAGAAELGIVHAPGYALYLLVAKLFTYLPFGDVAYRVNLLSAVSLSGMVAIMFGGLRALKVPRYAAGAAVLAVGWSYYVWSSGIRAEVYTPQLLTIAAVFAWLAYLSQQETVGLRGVLVAGGLVGVMMAMHPGSILVTPGIVVAFLLLRLPWHWALAAGALSVVVFLVPLAYFPLRYAAGPALNIAGTYDAAGDFQAVDLSSIGGVIWLLRGGQFDSFFFANGIFPSLAEWAAMFRLVWANTLGVGLLLVVVGAVQMFREQRGVFLVWGAALLPYFYFYTTYGAGDRETMIGPVHMLLGVAVAFGLAWVLSDVAARWRGVLALILPLTFLLVNFPLLNLRQDTTVYDRATIILDTLPEGAKVVGRWFDVIPLEYLQIIEGRRRDVTVYNTFLFEDGDTLQRFITQATTTDVPLILLGEDVSDYVLPTTTVTLQPIQKTVPQTNAARTQALVTIGYYAGP